MTHITCIWPMDMALGEGPVWSAADQALRFVDIKRGHVHALHPHSDTRTSLYVGGKPSFIVPATNGGYIVGSVAGLHWLTDAGLSEPFVTIPHPEHNRTNDATVAPDGRLWFGTMDDNECHPTGRLWCLDRGVLHETAISAVVTNGPAFSTDGQWLYFVDSAERTVWRYAMGDDGMPAHGRPLVTLRSDEGYPDGVVVDAQDCVWVALWDGWGVRRYAPDGTLLLHVALPCARVTKLAFGGPALAVAYVTTARVGLDPGDLAHQPLAGSLFSFTPPCPGAPTYRVEI